ncbi:MAG: hypothetical protein ACLTZT_06945 [Butyricimonas faecalis]
MLINEVSKPYFNNDFFHLSLLNEGKILSGGRRERDTDISIITMAKGI